jgi:enoyl-CoA hydratase
MKKTLVRYEPKDGIGWIVLDDPPANAYTHEMMRQLDEAILAARFDPAVHVLVLRGAGEKFFCAGADIEMLRGADPVFKYYFCLHANETLCRLEQTPKLVIAALNGHTVGGGLEVALAADLRVARRGAGKIGLPEVHLGVLPGTGGTQRLARVIGRSRALELMVSGRNSSFEEAREIGLVHEVFEAEGFDARVDEYARGFLPPSRASMAVGHIKRAVVTGSEVSFEAALGLERELQQRLFESDDAREGLEAYLAKRPPRFTGR